MHSHILDLVFLTPNDKIQYEMESCHEINSTCGVDFDTLKRLVGIFGRLQSHLNFNCCFVCPQLIPHDCSAIFSNIQFNDRKFNDCNEIFKLQNTEVGTCFTANGLYFYDFDLKKLPLRYRRGDMERRLTFDFLYDKLYTPYVSKVLCLCFLSSVAI